MEIKVLGPGCAKCNKTEKLLKQVVAETGVGADIENVTDMLKISEYNVMATPAIVVNGEVKCTGKIPKKEEIKAWLGK